jgi:hypothetical protein
VRPFPLVLLVSSAVVSVLVGCAAGPEPAPPGGSAPPPTPARGFENIVSGASDSVGARVGSEDALYTYRFRQIEPASDRFTFQDRDLSFVFRPAPDALFFQVENRQDRPVWIDWDRSVFYAPVGGTGAVAHQPTTWRERFGAQAQTQIIGLQRYSDYVFPVDYLLDPAGRDQQIRRPLFPEGEEAPQYSDRTFGVDLVFIIEDRPRTYPFRFKVASVLPR